MKRSASNQRSSAYPQLFVRLAAAGILLLAFGLMVSSAVRKSATVDEQSHLFRGVAYVKEGATHFLLGHPLLGGTLSALPLLTESELKLPLDTPAWEAGDWSLAGDQFLWQLNEDPLRLIFVGRMPVIWMTLLLGALVFRWAAEWSGARVGLAAGLLAMAVVVLDPNMLAHGRFITGDLPLVLFFTLSLFGYWRWYRSGPEKLEKGLGFLRERSAFYLLLSGVGLGLAAATKFSAALLAPILITWAVFLTWKRRSATSLAGLLVVGLVGWFTVWATYGFALWRGIVPGGAFWDDVAWQLTYVGEQHGVYLLGQISPSGWLAYFPVAFGLKTPIVTLALLAAAVVLLAQRRAVRALLFLLVPAIIYFVGSMIVALNIGYRYLLPILPLLAVLIGTAIVGIAVRERRPIVWAAVLAGSYVALALWTWPDYVPYYNVFGGRESWQILSDSNVDWGQDLVALSAWQKGSDAELKLSYFGTAHPSAYDVSFEPMPTWAPGPEQGNPAQQPYNPADPAPGTYAISVTNLHGVVLGDARDSFAFFRDMEVKQRVGGSIFVYQVDRRGEPVDVAYSGATPADVAPAIHERFNTNDVRIRWLDVEQSLVFPPDGGWLVARGAPALWIEDPALPTLEVPERFADQLLYRLPQAPEIAWDGAGSLHGFGLVFLGQEGPTKTDQLISLMTAWRVEETTDRPLQIFVHALDKTGQISGQWDGLGIDPGSWQVGDVFIQRHEIEVPAGQMPTSISIGVYDRESGERLGEPTRYPLDH